MSTISTQTRNFLLWEKVREKIARLHEFCKDGKKNGWAKMDVRAIITNFF